MGPKYWQQIAIEAQADGAYFSAMARYFQRINPVDWLIYQQRAAAAYARARWAMSSEECP